MRSEDADVSGRAIAVLRTLALPKVGIDDLVAALRSLVADGKLPIDRRIEAMAALPAICNKNAWRQDHGPKPTTLVGKHSCTTYSAAVHGTLPRRLPDSLLSR